MMRGGGIGSRSLTPSGESRGGGGEGEYERGVPPENFVKSMYLRTHFKPF